MHILYTQNTYTHIHHTHTHIYTYKHTYTPLHHCSTAPPLLHSPSFSKKISTNKQTAACYTFTCTEHTHTHTHTHIHIHIVHTYIYTYTHTHIHSLDYMKKKNGTWTSYLRAHAIQSFMYQQIAEYGSLYNISSTQLGLFKHISYIHEGDPYVYVYIYIYKRRDKSLFKYPDTFYF